MASPDILDFGKLLTPIEGDNPAGADIREDSSPTSVYYQLKDARSAARAAERNSEMDEEAGSVAESWHSILALAPEVLATHAKDLEVAAWLTEALLRTENLAGLRDGFRLMKEMTEQFWDGLYPLEDEDGLETKVAPLTGLNGEGADGTLIQPLRKVIVAMGQSDGAFAFWQYEQASELSTIADEEKRQARLAAGAIPMETIERAVSETPADFFSDFIEDAAAALEEFKAMNAALDAHCGTEGPPAANIRELLSSIHDQVRYLARDKLALSDDEAPAPEGEAAPAAAGGAAAAQPARASGEINNRDDAFRLLLKVAEYFRRSEPHSVIPYTLEEIVRRGRLSLPDLIAELIPDETAREGFMTRAGIDPSRTLASGSSE